MKSVTFWLSLLSQYDYRGIISNVQKYIWAKKSHLILKYLPKRSSINLRSPTFYSGFTLLYLMAKAVAQQEDGPLYPVLLVKLNDLVHLYKASFIFFCLLGGFCLFVWMKQISLGLLYQAPLKIVSEFLISFCFDVASKLGFHYYFLFK